MKGRECFRFALEIPSGRSGPDPDGRHSSSSIWEGHDFHFEVEGTTGHGSLEVEIPSVPGSAGHSKGL